MGKAEKRFRAPRRARMFGAPPTMSRPETSATAAAPPAVVAPRAFLALAAGFLLLYAGVLVSARQQRADRSRLESVVPLPPRPEPAPASPGPAPAPVEP